jgi:hypothetical protein
MQPGLVVLDDDALDSLDPDAKRRWKGYVYKMTYEVWDEESSEIGETDNKGWEEEGSSPYDTLHELIRAIDNHSWLEWSSSHPDGKRDWLISEDDQDYRTGDRTIYNLWIEREDKLPLSREEIAYINHSLHVR